jgi:hypothetical protein
MLQIAAARMQICATGISVGRDVGRFSSLVTKFSKNRRGRQFLHRYIAVHNDLLWRAIKRLPPPFPPRMTGHANFDCRACNRLLGECVLC